MQEKLYYSVKEVSDIIGVEEYVLRYWEKEFSQLRPKRHSGRRRYTKKDIDLLFKIKKLLYEEGFTIKGARTKLNESNTDNPILEEKGAVPADLLEYKRILKEVKEELKNIKEKLHNDSNRNDNGDSRNTLW